MEKMVLARSYSTHPTTAERVTTCGGSAGGSAGSVGTADSSMGRGEDGGGGPDGSGEWRPEDNRRRAIGEFARRRPGSGRVCHVERLSRLGQRREGGVRHPHHSAAAPLRAEAVLDQE